MKSHIRKFPVFFLLFFCKNSSQKNLNEAYFPQENFIHQNFLSLELKNHIKIFSYKNANCLESIRSEEFPIPVLKDCIHDELNNSFLLEKINNESYHLVSKIDMKCMNFSSEKNKIYFANCSNSDKNQEIKIASTPESDYLFYNLYFPNSKKCLDIKGEDQGTSRVANLHLFDCHTGVSQKFHFSQINSKKKNQIQKIIWTFWDKGQDNMPDFYKSNLKVWNQILNKKNPGSWEIKVLNTIKGDPNYYGNFIDESQVLPISFLEERISSEEKKLNATVVFSDGIRLELLHKYGGVWLDPSNMLHKSLDSLVNTLEHISSFEVLGYTSFSQSTKKLRYADSLENFFIMATQESELIKIWKENFIKYWKLKKAGMSIENHPMINGSLGTPKIDTESFRSLKNYLNQHVMLKYTLTLNEHLNDRVLILGGSHLNDDGPFALLQMNNWSDEELFKIPHSNFSQYLKIIDKLLISKFPSNNSRFIRSKNIDYFDSSNIFGAINTHSVNE